MRRRAFFLSLGFIIRSWENGNLRARNGLFARTFCCRLPFKTFFIMRTVCIMRVWHKTATTTTNTKMKKFNVAEEEEEEEEDLAISDCIHFMNKWMHHFPSSWQKDEGVSSYSDLFCVGFPSFFPSVWLLSARLQLAMDNTSSSLLFQSDSTGVSKERKGWNFSSRRVNTLSSVLSPPLPPFIFKREREGKKRVKIPMLCQRQWWPYVVLSLTYFSGGGGGAFVCGLSFVIGTIWWWTRVDQIQLTARRVCLIAKNK